MLSRITKRGFQRRGERGKLFDVTKQLMLPAHYHDVTYESYLVKYAAGAHKEPNKKY